MPARWRTTMLNVFFTVDVEVWCDGWQDIDGKFADSFRRYVYGPTSRGDYGLPYTLKVLNDHGLHGVFFVEPLFAARFGVAPLAEIVGLIRDAKQEVQLHLHTEWVDEARERLLDDDQRKRQYLRQFSLNEQVQLIAAGKRLIEEAGAQITAFRAGGFGFNIDTLRALAANSVAFDSSYNATHFGPDSGVMPGRILSDAVECEGVYEYPMSIFEDGTGSLRHVQLTSCSYGEMEGLLWQALEAGRNSFVVLSHNFELLNPGKTRRDDVVVRRFHKLCAFLDRHRAQFRLAGFSELTPRTAQPEPPLLRASLAAKGLRVIEQAYRWRFR